MQIQDRIEDVEQTQSRYEQNRFSRILAAGLEKLPVKSHRIVLFLILAISAFLRFYDFPNLPGGIMQDEVSAAYESYALLLHGTDRWGNRFPIYFISWGSGQNVLQSYLNVPFIKVFGLNIFAVRLLPVFLGLLTIIVMYKLVQKIFDTKTALLAAFLVGTLPWHIMLSRWGYESNMLPCFLLLGIATLVYCYESKYNRWLIPFSLTFLAVSLYAYALAIFVVPGILLLYVLFHFKTIWKHKIGFVLSLGVFLLLAFPFLLLILDNYILHSIPQFVRHLPFTVPLLLASRLEQLDASWGNDYNTILSWNAHFMRTDFFDGVLWNTVGSFQPVGLLNLPLAIIGSYYSWRKRQTHAKIFVYWLVATLPLFFIAPLNDSHDNAVFLPFIALNAIGMIGIYQAIDKKRIKTALLSLILVAMSIYNGLFCYYYFNSYNRTVKPYFYYGIDGALAKATAYAFKDEPIYVSDQVTFNYLYTLFYLHVDPQDFQQHSQVFSAYGIYYVRNYRNYYFLQGDRKLTSAPSYVSISRWDGVPQNCKGIQMLYWNSDWVVERCFNRI